MSSSLQQYGLLTASLPDAAFRVVQWLDGGGHPTGRKFCQGVRSDGDNHAHPEAMDRLQVLIQIVVGLLPAGTAGSPVPFPGLNLMTTWREFMTPVCIGPQFFIREDLEKLIPFIESFKNCGDSGGSIQAVAEWQLTGAPDGIIGLPLITTPAGNRVGSRLSHSMGGSIM